MKLYYSPGACSMIVRMVLHQVGETFEATQIDLSVGEQRSSSFLSINPKGKVPTVVRDDGSILTELGTILTWIAERHPGSGLMPREHDQALRTREAVEYCISTIHALATTRIFVPSSFGSVAEEKAIRAEGRQRLTDGLAILNEQFAAGDHFTGRLTIADFMIFWLALGALMSGLQLPSAVQRGYEAMMQLDSVTRALAEEGFA